MNGMGFHYFPLDALDGDEHYCLADTMALVNMHRGAFDAVREMQDKLGGRRMIIIKDVVAESAAKCKELGDVIGTKRNFENALGLSLDKSGVPFFSMELPAGVVSAARVQYAKKEYTNKQGKPLSIVDCRLLCVAMHSDNVDVMTADKALMCAIEDKCGAGRTLNPRARYYERRLATCRFIKTMLGTGVAWREDGTTLEYVSGEAKVAGLDISKPEPVMLWCNVEGNPWAGEVIQEFYMVSLLEGYCPCGTYDGDFKCTCGGNHYDAPQDSGLEQEEIDKFLDSLPFWKRKRLQTLVKSV